ncbi:TIGR01777 family oxidoreductase [Nonlabens tegetincola]|uniref:TIGR01777 family oxidoreductase n=1 Tax=Nonlabens tegetincola TaxID=323273 RepID=UPI000CF54F7E|nr:TIGR01777 family oxidoreductase [Nonlabens tegetincola]PQJ19456.1 TIGR01777 family protein [Nonlabens tegetincola]
MKVLITGATGLVGKQIVDDLHEKGHVVHYLTTRQEAIKDEPNYKGFLWNVKEGSIDVKCLEGVTNIIHLAGETVFQRWTDDAKKRIMDSRVFSTQLLIDTLKNNKHQVEHVTTASAIGIYPDQQDGRALKENEIPPTASNFLADVCIAWEKIGALFTQLGLKHSIVRIGIVLSDNGGALDQMSKPVKYYAGAGFGNGKMWQSWIAIDDLSGIFIHIAQEQLEGIYNGVAPNPVRNRNMMETIGKVIGKPVFLPNVPKFVMKMMLGEMSAIVLSSQHVSSEKIEKTGYTFEYRELENALQNYLS